MALDSIGDKKPPYNLEAEQSCLGSIILDNTYINDAIQKLKLEDFYFENHRMIYQSIIEIADRNQPVDLVTLTNELKNKNALERIGGVEYLNNIANIVPSSANFEYYAQIVIDKALSRKLITASNQILTYIYEENLATNELMDRAEKIIFDVTNRRITQDFQKVESYIVNTIQYIEKLFNRQEYITGVPSGLLKLDEITSGFQNSELIILAARPSKGKSSLALNIGEYAAIEKKVPVGFFSLEMAAEQLLIRLLGSQAKVDIKNLRTGFLSSSDWAALMDAAALLHDAPIYIDDTPNISLMELRAKARRAVTKYGIKLIIVDYLQLITLNLRRENKQQEITEISGSLKALARELKIPIIALSQLRRLQNEDERPQLSDLRESGAIEQDADVVIFIHSSQEETEAETLETEIIVAKQRNGPTKSLQSLFLKRYTKFVNYQKE